MHLTRSSLLARGWTDGGIARAVRDGRLVRIRAGHFLDEPLDHATIRAIRIGGRLACLSELRHRGIWVLDTDDVHVHLAANASRLRRDPMGRRCHWAPLIEPARSSPDHVGLVDAVSQAWECLGRREWIASVDSAIHSGQLRARDVATLRSRLVAPARRALTHVDARAESGLESIARTVAVDLGFRVRSQVTLPRIGRVDLIVEDWIVIEADGTAFHDVALASSDRRRDALLAAGGWTVVRPGYSLLIHDLETFARQLIGAVATHRRVQDSGRLAARARRRLAQLRLA